MCQNYIKMMLRKKTKIWKNINTIDSRLTGTKALALAQAMAKMFLFLF